MSCQDNTSGTVPTDDGGTSDASFVPPICAQAKTFGALLDDPAEVGAGPFEGDWTGKGELILYATDKTAHGPGPVSFTMAAMETEVSIVMHYANGDCTFIGERAGSRAVFSAGQRCEQNPATSPSLPFTLCGGVSESPSTGVVTMQLEGVLDEVDGHVWSGALIEILVFKATPEGE